MNNNPKVAVCLWGTMRSPNSCLNTLYKNIIEPFDVIAGTPAKFIKKRKNIYLS
jgi:hypothetical protein